MSQSWIYLVCEVFFLLSFFLCVTVTAEISKFTIIKNIPQEKYVYNGITRPNAKVCYKEQCEKNTNCGIIFSDTKNEHVQNCMRIRVSGMILFWDIMMNKNPWNKPTSILIASNKMSKTTSYFTLPMKLLVKRKNLPKRLRVQKEHESI